jgi:hypothetical protein
MAERTIAPIDWVRTLGSGLLAGAAFVAVAMVVENKAIKAGSRLFSK